MRALFLPRSGMRANQSTAVVYIASSLFWRLSGSVGVCGISRGVDVLCACREGGMTNDLSEVDFLAKI